MQAELSACNDPSERNSKRTRAGALKQGEPSYIESPLLKVSSCNDIPPVSLVD